MEHAFYSPSDAPRWLPCSAALVAYPKGKDDNNEAAQEGTDAHTLLEACLKSSQDAAEFIGEEMFEGAFGLPTQVTEELAEGLQPVLDYVSDRYFNAVDNEEPALWSEMRVSIHDDCWGTLDCALYWKKAGLLEIIDLKWGQGHMVEADTSQLSIYAAGVVATRKIAPKTIIQTIAQPRGHHPDGPFRQHEVSSTELMLFNANVTEMIDERAKGGFKPEYAPSDDACRWCPGKDDCTARQELAMSHARHAEDTELPANGFDEDMEYLIEFGDLIIDKINLARARLTDQILMGGQGHGYKCTEARANRKLDFDTPEEAVEYFREKMKMRLGDCTEPKLLGIPALEKVVKKLYPKKIAMLTDHIVKPQGQPKLVPESHKGKPYKKRVEAMFDDEASNESNFL